MKFVGESAPEVLEWLYGRVKSVELEVFSAEIYPQYSPILGDSGKIDFENPDIRWYFRTVRAGVNECMD